MKVGGQIYQNNFEQLQYYLKEKLIFVTLKSVFVVIVCFCFVLSHASLQISRLCAGLVTILTS